MNVPHDLPKINMEKSHVVILGAGCSKAALPQGDANGKCLPLMEDFLDIVDSVKKVLESAGVSTHGKNFEEIYSRLVATGNSDLQECVEKLIFQYFEALSLPFQPTLYDHLLLSLREKDDIATFNWDPLLLQALKRNLHILTKPPQFRFLHGNVEVGFCESHKTQGFTCLVFS